MGGIPTCGIPAMLHPVVYRPCCTRIYWAIRTMRYTGLYAPRRGILGYTHPGIHPPCTHLVYTILPGTPPTLPHTARRSAWRPAAQQCPVLEPWAQGRGDTLGESLSASSGPQECDERYTSARRILLLFLGEMDKDWIAFGSFPTVLPWERERE